MEATGGLQTASVASIAAAGLSVAVVNPRQIRALARVAKAIGVLAKTDNIDALVLAPLPGLPR